jgi:hypothetical protein
MSKRTLLIIAIVSLFSLAVAQAASYGIFLAGPAQVGGVKLANGAYIVKVEGNKVSFTEVKSKKTVATANGKVEKASKVAVTEVLGPKSADGVTKIEAVQVAGYDVKITIEGGSAASGQ